ncbi:GIY-YIG nuclease family protein [Maribacter sp. PR1]|uniref:GIY-YIG nuclease family protein n=1 Tax=Maribacter cobaltidurans TaxID=1178778 RepID=A0ABU7IQ50_9FLAO|nr:MULTISPECIES: GIY-YIG nuclease family protein [Maribacter]MDC6387695.1 GIY-YIG nuclease family protein [Maribacter sp. PR1]MEE1975084.1 GIY-YIG nuclease family protein [Maribacter cobaltidurans]
MHYVYIIQSFMDKSFYIGKTSNLETRLIFHNNVELNTGVTRRKIPWQYFFTLPVDNALIAGKIENHIKKMKSRQYIKNLVKHPEMGKTLIKRFS